MGRRGRSRRVAPIGPARWSRRLLAHATGVAVTSVVLAGLVVLKVATRPAWRNSARASVIDCLSGDWPAGPHDRLHLIGRLAGCLARLEPASTEYLELATALLLVTLLVTEIRLLVHDRHAARGQLPNAPSARPVSLDRRRAAASDQTRTSDAVRRPLGARQRVSGWSGGTGRRGAAAVRTGRRSTRLRGRSRRGRR